MILQHSLTLPHQTTFVPLSFPILRLPLLTPKQSRQTMPILHLPSLHLLRFDLINMPCPKNPILPVDHPLIRRRRQSVPLMRQQPRPTQRHGIHHPRRARTRCEDPSCPGSCSCLSRTQRRRASVEASSELMMFSFALAEGTSGGLGDGAGGRLGGGFVVGDGRFGHGYGGWR